MRAPRLSLTLLVLFGALSSSPAQDVLEVPEEQQIQEALQTSDAPTPDAQDVQEVAEAAVNPNPLSSLELESLSATRTAPLFTPSRTGPIVEAPVEAMVEAPPPPPEVAPEQPPPALQLVGIVLTDAAKMALLKDPGSNEVHRLNSGDEYEGWSVTVVDARSIEFRSGERVEALKMFESFPTPASYGMPGGLPFDPTMPELGGLPPMPDPATRQPPPPPDAQFDGIPPEDIAPDAGAPAETPPQNFDPQTGELLIPDEGPLQVEGDPNTQQ